MPRRLLALLLSACTLVTAERAQATYSTLAMERSTGRYGAVSASCVPLSALERVYASVRDHGAVLTQSYLVEGDTSQALALQLLGQGARAAEVIEAMTDPGFDPDFSLRQYVVLDAYGGFAGFSGLDAEPFAGHLDASDASFSVGVAGNFLTGAAVLDAAALGFRDEAACDLEERLVNALVASSADGLGDARCVVEGRPAQAVWLHVASSNGEAVFDLDISVDAATGFDPTLEVLERFSEWRGSHPCPVRPEMPNTASASRARDDRAGGCAIGLAGGGSREGWVWLLAVVGMLGARALALRRAVT